MNNKLILFRAGGGPGIGMGHVMRCLALAEMLRYEESFLEFAPVSGGRETESERAGMPVGFLSRPDSVVEHMVREAGFSFYTLDDDQFFFDRVKKLSPVALIVDDYRVDTQELAAVKKLVPLLVVVDDLNDRELPADLIINGNANGPSLGYIPDKQLLLGPEFVLLRPEFRVCPPKTIAERAQRLMVTFGGSDDLNLTPLVLEALRGLDLHIKVVVGLQFDNREVLRMSAANWNQPPAVVNPMIKTMTRPHSPEGGENSVVCRPHAAPLASPLEMSLPGGNTVELLENPDMAALMRWADLAVSAGGSTLYELCATGTPAVVVAAAKNQVASSRALDELGCVRYLGYYNEVFPSPVINSVEDNSPGDHWRVKRLYVDSGRGDPGGHTTAEGSILRQTVLSLAADPARRAEMSRYGQSLVDGLGGKRCAIMIGEMIRKKLS